MVALEFGTPRAVARHSVYTRFHTKLERGVVLRWWLFTPRPLVYILFMRGGLPGQNCGGRRSTPLRCFTTRSTSPGVKTAPRRAKAGCSGTQANEPTAPKKNYRTCREWFDTTIIVTPPHVTKGCEDVACFSFNAHAPLCVSRYYPHPTAPKWLQCASLLTPRCV